MRSITFLLLLMPLTSGTPDTKPDITTDWCRMGLKGKVKVMHYTLYERKVFRNKRTKTEVITKFNPTGFIDCEVETIRKHKHFFTEYSYAVTDSVINVTKRYSRSGGFSTSYDYKISKIGNNKVISYCEGDSLGIMTHIYEYDNNNRLLSEETTPSKKYTPYSYTNYTYNASNDQIIEVASQLPNNTSGVGFDNSNRYTDATTYYIEQKDNYGNPTLIKSVQHKHSEDTSIKHISYTYY